jgi:hypothetical protein
MRTAGSIIVAMLSVSWLAAHAEATPGVELTDGGRTIVYRVQAGDSVAGVAQALGVPVAQVESQMTAQGVRDGGLPAGLELRVANPLAVRADAAETRASDLARRLAAVDAAGDHAVRPREQPSVDQRLAQLEGRWQLAFWAIVALALGLAVAGALAAIARRRERGATRYARSMAQELEDKRRSTLEERQQSARRIVELEDRVRQLETQRRPGGLTGIRSA